MIIHNGIIKKQHPSKGIDLTVDTTGSVFFQADEAAHKVMVNIIDKRNRKTFAGKFWVE
jgi:hypothetical protein